MEIERAWSTPIAKLHLELPLEMRAALVHLLLKQEGVLTENTYDNKITKGTADSFNDSLVNLFDYSKYGNEATHRIGQYPSNMKYLGYLQQFEQTASKLIRDYIEEAWDLDRNSEIKIRGFGNIQRTLGRRTGIHHHHGWDGVFLHYLTVGGEKDLLSVELEDWDFYHKPYHTDYSGDLIMVDPRGPIKMPYNEKGKTFKPEVGLTIIHPAYLWHETHTHTGIGTRVGIVINFNVVNKNCDKLPTLLVPEDARDR